MSLTLLQLTWVAAAGAGVGFLSGMFGLGGGFLIVPVLHIALRVPMELAVGAGACQVLGPATTSLLARKVERSRLRFPLTILGGMLIGVFSGVWCLGWIRDFGRDNELRIFGKTVPPIDFTVLGVYFLLLLSVGLFAVWESHNAVRGKPSHRFSLASWRIPPYASFPEFGETQSSIPLLTWFGLVVGFLSGFLGMSGGLIVLPGLIYLLGIPTQDAVKSSLIIVWIIAVQNTIAHAWQNHIDLWLVMALLIGGTIGARLGSEFGLKLAARQLRRRFGWLLIVTAVLIGARLAVMIVEE